MENLHWAPHVTTGREMRINRCLWSFRVLIPGSGQPGVCDWPCPAMSLLEACHPWENTLRVPTSSKDLLCHCHQSTRTGRTSLVLLLTLKSPWVGESLHPHQGAAAKGYDVPGAEQSQKPDGICYVPVFWRSALPPTLLPAGGQGGCGD